MFDYAEIEDSVAGAGLATTIETLKSFGDPTLEPTIDDRRRWIAFLRSAAFAVDRQGTPPSVASPCAKWRSTTRTS